MRRIIAIVSAFALLMGLAGMSIANTPSPYDWQGNGYPNASCDAGSTTALWIWTGDQPLSLTINGHEQTGSWTQMGNGSWHWTITIDGVNFPPTTASITYTGKAGTLTLSGCDEGGAQPTLLPGITPTPAPTAALLPGITPTPAPTAALLPGITPTPAPTATPLPEITPTPAPTATPTPAPTATPTPAGTVAAEIGMPDVTLSPAPTAIPTPAGTVAAEIGMPDVTLPPTDMLGSVQLAPSNDGLRLVLIGLATLLISVLAFTEPRRSSRRR